MMPSWFQILIVVLLAVLLFGRGKISSMMGDVAKGITAFKKGMKEGESEDATADKQLKEGGPTIDVAATATAGAADAKPAEKGKI